MFNVYSYAEIFLILYPPLENSTTRTAIAAIPVPCMSTVKIIRLDSMSGDNFGHEGNEWRLPLKKDNLYSLE